MSAYHQLLAATVGYLQQQRDRGQRHVVVDSAKLRALTKSTPDPESKRETKIKSGSFTELRASLTNEKIINPVLPAANFGFGSGNKNADLLFVVEDINRNNSVTEKLLESEPGQLLGKIVNAMNLSCEEIYIVNTLKPYPSQSTKRSHNQTTNIEERTPLSEWLQREIESCRPKIIVALGKAAAEVMLNEKIQLTHFRGTWQTYIQIPLMPTFHPAYLLRNQALTEKRKIWEDMMAVMEKMALPVSEKQRGFFLPN